MRPRHATDDAIFSRDGDDDGARDDGDARGDATMRDGDARDARTRAR